MSRHGFHLFDSLHDGLARPLLYPVRSMVGHFAYSPRYTLLSSPILACSYVASIMYIISRGLEVSSD